MKLVQDPQAVDRDAIERLGIPGLLLMDAAGRAVAAAVQTHLAALGLPPSRSPVVVLCGPGHNGGDGLVCARALAQAGIGPVTVVTLTEPDTLTGDPATMARFLRFSDVRWCGLAEVEPALSGAAVVVDALFGSGLSRPLSGPVAAVVDGVNRDRAAGRFRVVAVDVPSGVQAATGAVLGTAIQADETVTNLPAKLGLYLYPGRACAGRVTGVDIGIPTAAWDADPGPFRLLTAAQCRADQPARPAWGHKGTFGHVGVLAGSRAMPGAAALAATAALRVGSGLVTVATPESALAAGLLRAELMRLPLPETADGFLASGALPALRGRLPHWSSLVVGPGLGTHSETPALLAGLFDALAQTRQTLVLDADGLNTLAADSALRARFRPLARRAVLTPHVGEAARLLGSLSDAVGADLPAAALALQQAFSATVVLKSATTLVATPDGHVWVSPLGHTGMATGGTGDVLAGVIAGLLAQGAAPEAAARAGVWLHGTAAERVALGRGALRLCAGDLIDALPEACFA